MSRRSCRHSEGHIYVKVAHLKLAMLALKVFLCDENAVYIGDRVSAYPCRMKRCLSRSGVIITIEESLVDLLAFGLGNQPVMRLVC